MGNDAVSTAEEPDNITQVLLQYINSKYGLNYRFVRQLHGGFQGKTCVIEDKAEKRQAVLKWDPRKDKAQEIFRAAETVAQARAAGWPAPEWLLHGVSPTGEPFTVQEYIPLASGSHWNITTELAEAVVDFVQHKEADVHLDTDVDWSAWDRACVFDDAEQCAARLAAHSPEGAKFVETASAWVAEFKDVKRTPRDVVHGDFQPGNFLLAEGRIAYVVDVEVMGKGSRFHDVADFACHNIIWQGESVTTLPVLDAYAAKYSAPGEWEVSLMSRMYFLLSFYIFLFHGDAKSRLEAAMDAIEYVKARKNRQP